MRAVRNTDAGLGVVDVAEPDGDGVLVHVRSASICGSDFEIIRRWGPMPVTLGHEIAGVLEDGTPVAIDPSGPCGRCDQCRSGRSNVCRSAAERALGFARDGGMAERIVVAGDALVPLAASLRVEDASLVEPVGVAVHGLRLADVDGGMRVAVVGGGGIGLAAVAAAATTGCEVGLEARHDAQRTAGERLGARGPAEGEYDVVIDAAGTEGSLARAVELAAPAATILLLSTPWDPVVVTGYAASMKELRLRWSFTYNVHAGGRDLDAAAALLARNPDIAATLITHRFPLEDAREAFRVAADRAHGAIKVMVEP
jgi:threonine dehydrogenase-like Zn-dependent dehydrogenase